MTPSWKTSKCNKDAPIHSDQIQQHAGGALPEILLYEWVSDSKADIQEGMAIRGQDEKCEETNVLQC